MNERTEKLRAAQERAFTKVGAEFTTVDQYAKAVGLGRDETRRLLRGLPRIGGKVNVFDAAERVFDELHPRPRRAG